MRTTARLLFCFLPLFLVPNRALALDRVAFIIGNDAYPDVPLDNAVRDARAVKAMLTGKLGFPEAGILVAEDADRLTIFEKFEEFKGLAKEADIVMVFYAGHGMESLDGKENFLIPVDAQIAKAAQSEAALRATGVNLMDLSTQLAAATTGAKIILMDCCRERPAGRGAARAGGGLVTYADAEIPADTLMILAAAPNKIASDGERHGPFTEALLAVLPGNGSNLMDAFFAVSDRVREVTGDQQVPWLKFDGSGQIFRQQKFLAVAGPSAIKPVPAEPDPKMSEVEIERRAKEMAERLVTEAMRKQPAPAVPTLPPKTPKPMVRTDPVPPGAFPAGSGMEGSRAGEVRTFGGIEMVWCPPGEFLMGSPEDEADRNDDETQHLVTLTRGFWMAKTETTQGQWESITGHNPSEFIGEERPVERISWDDVQGWLEKMNERHPLAAGWRWELPTEAQWEYACRAGAGSTFAGDLDEMAWYYENRGSTTNPVGTKKANAWGLHDMHGNVWEWCSDWYGDYASGSASDPTGVADGWARVLRGGSWLDLAALCRSADRDQFPQGYESHDLGFRPAAVPTGRAEAMRKQPAPAVPTLPPETPKPMVRTDLVLPGAFPAGSGMEGARAGEVRTFGGIEMVWCPPGEFLMGSPASEVDRYDDETQHRVTLTRGFWMAKTETTQGQWERVMGENPSSFTGEDLPVNDVSWDDVQGWLEKMNETTPLPSGWKWTLPTEAQREYACRAGTGSTFAGDLDEMAWYDENSGSTTNPVGTKKANAWGLHDMHGNVSEWCSDWYGDYASGSASDPTGAVFRGLIITDSPGVADGSTRVIRGGGWYDGAAYCRSAARDRIAHENRSSSLGFRPAAVPTGR